MDKLQKFLIDNCTHWGIHYKTRMDLISGIGVYNDGFTLSPQNKYPQLNYMPGELFFLDFFDRIQKDFKLNIPLNKADSLWNNGKSLPIRDELIEFLKNHTFASDYLHIIKDDKDLILQHIKDIKKPNRQQGLKGEFQFNFSYIKRHQYHSNKEVDALLLFTQYFKNIIKKDEVKIAFCNFIAEKVKPEYYSKFEKIVKRPIIIEKDENFLSISQSQTLNIDKEKILQQITFRNKAMPGVIELNNVQRMFKSSIINSNLGISDVDLVEFEAGKKTSKIYITSDKPIEDIKEIYLKLMSHFAYYYGTKENETYLESSKKIISHHLLEKSIPHKDEKITKMKI